MADSDSHINVRVSAKKRPHTYADFIKHRFDDGVETVMISGLGSAISVAISVADLLSFQKLAEFTKIFTSRGEAEGSPAVERIEIAIKKPKNFSKIYAQIEKERKERVAAINDS